MAIIGGLFGILGRFAGRLVNSSLGWATMLLFGKVSGRNQTMLLAIALGSLLWVVLLVGVVLPDVGVALLAFVPAPSFVSRDLIRLGMFIGALALPVAVGIAAIFVTEKASRPRGAAVLPAIIRGYPFTLLLAVTIAFLAVVATVRKVQSLARRWEDAHVPVIVKPGRYTDVLAQLEEVLRRGGLEVVQEPAPAVLSIPPKLLDRVAGKGLGSLVPDRLMLLKAKGLEALVYPSDVAIAGTKANVAAARALIAAELTHAPAYLTTAAESEAVEDQLRAIADRTEAVPEGQLRQQFADVDRTLMRLTVPFDEWETVYRERLQVERDVLTRPTQPTSVEEPPPKPRARAFEFVLAAGTMALLALDVALLAADRLGGGRRRRSRRR